MENYDAILGNMPDRFISGISDYLINGSDASQELPFITQFQESSGDEGLTEEEFFFLLNLYEGRGDEMLMDLVEASGGEVADTFGGYKMGQTPKSYKEHRKSMQQNYEKAKTEKPDIGRAPHESEWDYTKDFRTKATTKSQMGDDLDIHFGKTTTTHGNPKDHAGKWKKDILRQAENIKGEKKQQKFLDEQYSKLYNENIFKEMKNNIRSHGKGLRGETAAEIMKTLDDMDRVHKMKLLKMSRKEKRHLNKIQQLQQKLLMSQTGQTASDIKQQIALERRRRQMEREAAQAQFMRDYRESMANVRKTYPGLWRSILFGKRGQLADPTVKHEGIIRGTWNAMRKAITGWETIDDQTAANILKNKAVTDKDGKKINIQGEVSGEGNKDVAVARGYRRVPGLMHLVGGMRKKGDESVPEGTVAKKLKTSTKPVKYTIYDPVRGKHVEKTVNVPTGGGLLQRGGRQFKFAMLGLRGFEQDHTMHPFPQTGLTGKDARRYYKAVISDLRSIDAERWKIDRMLGKAGRKEPRAAELNKRLKMLNSYEKELNKQRKILQRNIMAAQKLQGKYIKGQIKMPETMRVLGPLVAVLGTAMVAAGVSWFKARHSRKMIHLSTRRVLREAARRGMVLTPAEVKESLRGVLRSPTKMRKVANAVEMAKAGVGVERAATLLSEIVLNEMGVSKMPFAKPMSIADLEAEPTAHGGNRGYLGTPQSGPSVARSLADFTL